MLHNRSFNPTTNSSVTLFTKYEEIIIFFFKSVTTLFFISLFFHAQKNGSILDQIERFLWIFDTNTVLEITHYLLKMFFLNLKKKISKSDFQQLQLFLPFLSINSTHTCVRSFHEPVSVWKEDDTRPPDPRTLVWTTRFLPWSSPLGGCVGVQHAAPLHPSPDSVHASQRLLLQATAAPLDALLDPEHEQNLRNQSLCAGC